MEPTEIFKGEVEETIEKVQIAVKILRAFRNTYEEHREKLKDYFKDKEPIEWEFAPQLVFHRYDKFLGRVETVSVSFYLNFIVNFKWMPFITSYIYIFDQEAVQINCVGDLAID